MYVDVWVAYSYVIIFLLIFIQMQLASRKRGTSELKSNFHSYDKNRRWGIVFVFVFIIIIFGVVVNQIWTAPYGDAIDHTIHISLIIENKKFPVDYSPVDPIKFILISYPPGFWCLGVFTSLFSFSSPMIAVTYTATTCAALIPLMIWSTVLIKTKSISISLIALFCSLIIPNWAFSRRWDGQDLVLGNLVNGSYPNQLGFTEIIGLFAFVFLQEEIEKIEASTRSEDEKFNLQRTGLVYNLFSFAGLILISAATILTHYLFTIFVVIVIGVKTFSFIFMNFKERITRGNVKRKNFYLMCLNGFIIGLVALIIFGTIWFIIPIIRTRIPLPTTDVIDSNFFTENPFGIIIDVSIIVFVMRELVWKKEISPRDLQYLLVIIVIFIIYFVPVTQQYFLTFGYRSIIPVAGVAVMQMSCDASPVLSVIRAKKINFFKIKEEKAKWTAFFILISLNVINTAIYPKLTNISIVGNSADYDAMVWINQNIGTNTLILNDPTFTGYFLPGFRYRNVVYVRRISQTTSSETIFYAERASRALEIFFNPSNYTNVQDIMQLYQIEYIYLTSQSDFFLFTNYTYMEKPYGVVNQVALFSANPYLERVWNLSTSAIFKLR